MSEEFAPIYARLGIAVLERGWLSSNNILCVDPTGCHTTLVDTGYGTHASQTVQWVQAALRGKALQHIVNTHLHSDHCGGNAALQQAYADCVTHIPPGESKAIGMWDESVLTYRATGQTCPRFRYDALLHAGQSIAMGKAQWQIHASPGHDPHSVIFFEPRTRTLISADALWQNGFGVIFPELSQIAGFEDTRTTLDLIASLDPLLVLPGHGAPFGMTRECPDAVRIAVQTAYRRLDGFEQEPARHARYAIKALIKFKLLEWQRVRMPDLQRWASQMLYFGDVMDTHFASLSHEEILAQLVQEMLHSGTLKLEGDWLLNE